MRISDTDRQRAIDELRRHCSAGRLDVDEYAARVERVLEANTLEDLDRVLGDLPMLRIADPSERALQQARPAGDHQGTAGGLSLGRRIAAMAVIFAAVAGVFAVFALVFSASWLWAGIMLAAGWLMGFSQSRLTRRR